MIYKYLNNEKTLHPISPQLVRWCLYAADGSPATSWWWYPAVHTCVCTFWSNELLLHSNIKWDNKYAFEFYFSLKSTFPLYLIVFLRPWGASDKQKMVLLSQTACVHTWPQQPGLRQEVIHTDKGGQGEITSKTTKVKNNMQGEGHDKGTQTGNLGWLCWMGH